MFVFRVKSTKIFRGPSNMILTIRFILFRLTVYHMQCTFKAEMCKTNYSNLLCAVISGSPCFSIFRAKACRTTTTTVVLPFLSAFEHVWHFWRWVRSNHYAQVLTLPIMNICAFLLLLFFLVVSFSLLHTLFLARTLGIVDKFNCLLLSLFLYSFVVFFCLSVFLLPKYVFFYIHR